MKSDAAAFLNHNQDDAKSEKTLGGDSSYNDSSASSSLRTVRWHSTRWFFCALALTWFFESLTVSGYTKGTLPVLEKQFSLSSTESGFIISAYEIGSLCATLFVSFYGGKGHRPRWIAVSNVIISFGCFLFVLPYLVKPPYQVIDSRSIKQDFCIRNSSTSRCISYDNFDVLSYVLLIVANTVIGLGTVAMFVLGLTYLQDSVEKRSFPIYIAVLYTLNAFGPAFGFIMCSVINRIFVNPWRWPDGLDDGNSRWVGAWWLGFLLLGVIQAILALPMFFFPQHLSSNSSSSILKPKDRTSTASSNTTASNEYNDDAELVATLGSNFHDVLEVVRYLLKNPVWLLHTFSYVVILVNINGMSTFIAKYFTATYGLSTSIASLYTGAILLPAAGLGILVGGVITRRLDSNEKLISNITICFGICAVFCLCTLLFIRCSQSQVAGVQVSYDLTQRIDMSRNDVVKAAAAKLFSEKKMRPKANLWDNCNRNCGCDPTEFSPVCRAGITYYNPCFAGCTSNSSCDCILLQGLQPNSSFLSLSDWAEYVILQEDDNRSYRDGMCDDCNVSFILFLVMLFLAIFFTCCGHNGLIITTLHAVPRRHRPMTMGIQMLLTRALSDIPAPLLFGAVLDTGCILWEDETTTCEDKVQGSCLLYNSNELPLKMFGLTVGLEFIACILIVMGGVAIRTHGDVFQHANEDKSSSTLNSNATKVTLIPSEDDKDSPQLVIVDEVNLGVTT